MSKSTIAWIPSDALKEGRRQIPRKDCYVLIGTENNINHVKCTYVDSYGMVCDLSDGYHPWTHFADMPKGPK